MSGEPFARPDLQPEPVGRRGQRTGPLGIERAGRLEGEVEVEDEARRGGAPTEIGALRGVEQVATGAVRLPAVRRVAEGQEQAAGVALHPVDLQALRPALE